MLGIVREEGFPLQSSSRLKLIVADSRSLFKEEDFGFIRHAKSGAATTTAPGLSPPSISPSQALWPKTISRCLACGIMHVTSVTVEPFVGLRMDRSFDRTMRDCVTR